MSVPTAKPTRAYTAFREAGFSRAVELAKKNKEVHAARVAFVLPQHDAVAFDKVLRRLDIGIATAMRQAMHLWLLHVGRELETAAEGDAKRKEEWAQTRGPKAKRKPKEAPRA